MHIQVSMLLEEPSSRPVPSRRKRRYYRRETLAGQYLGKHGHYLRGIFLPTIPYPVGNDSLPIPCIQHTSGSFCTISEPQLCTLYYNTNNYDLSALLVGNGHLCILDWPACLYIELLGLLPVDSRALSTS